MHPHVPHVLDTVVIAVITLSTATIQVLLGSADSAAQLVELKLLLLPFLGALVMSGGIIMLNPQIETRRIVIGRSIFALFCGTLAPQLISFFHPALADLSIKPIVQIATGGLIACLVYILSKPFTGKLYERADAISALGVQRLENRLTGQPDKDA
jgi:hypothetical protein